MAMPHIKSYVRHQGHQAGWVMIGSHNLSKAAWGSLIKGGSKLMIRSYELSVLLMPHLEAAYLGHPARGFRCARTLGQAATEGTAGAVAAGHPAHSGRRWRRALPCRQLRRLRQRWWRARLRRLRQRVPVAWIPQLEAESVWM